MNRFKNALEIENYDFINLTNGYPTPLKNVNNINEANEANISKIRFYFNTEDEAKNFVSKFPKSYLGKLSRISDYDFKTKEGYFYYGVSFYFNIFYTNGSTGDVNESAIARRAKVFKKLKEILN